MIKTYIEGKIKTWNPFYIVLTFTVPWKRKPFRARVPKTVVKSAIRYKTSDIIEVYLNSHYFNKNGWSLANFYIPVEILKEMI